MQREGKGKGKRGEKRKKTSFFIFIGHFLKEKGLNNGNLEFFLLKITSPKKERKKEKKKKKKKKKTFLAI